MMTRTIMMKRTTCVTGTFTVLGRDEQAYDAVAGMPTLTQATVSEELEGGIEGEASISYLTTYRDDEIASFVGILRFTGRVGDRSGSFVMQETGTLEDGVAMGHWTILPGSSTGELCGISGEGGYTAGHEHVSYSLDVSY